MKTTVEIDDALLAEAKKRAIDEHKPVRALIEDGLRWRILASPTSHRWQIRWVVADGGAPDQVRDRVAMYDWMRQDS